MITHQFYIKEERLNECKKHIRSIKSARFLQNPFKMGDKYSICVSFETNADSTQMDEVLEKWYKEDNPPKSKEKNIFKRIKKLFI
jgi:hypothetical protein